MAAQDGLVQNLWTKVQGFREKAKNAKIKERAEAGVDRAMTAGAIVAGGVSQGAMAAFLSADGSDIPIVPGTDDVEADLALGVIGTIAGAAGLGGKHADKVVSYFGGILAVPVARHSLKMFRGLSED